MSNNFQFVDLENLDFVSPCLISKYEKTAIDLDSLLQPNYMYIDYVRVYQRTDMINIGCNPDDYPTSE
jgi:hypothetical protein